MNQTFENKTSSAFPILFEIWCKENHISAKEIPYTCYSKVMPMFLTINDWATSTKEDRYLENDCSKKIDMEELADFMEKEWQEEMDFDITAEDFDFNFMKEESTSFFNRRFKYWMEEKSELLCNQNDYEIS